jgi:uncharacterized glyoxalase superfamily protein PhnB
MPTFKSLTPNLMVEDVPASIAFYRDRLGFAVYDQVPNPETGVMQFAIMGRDSVTIMFQLRASFHEDVPGTEGLPVGASATLYLQVDDIDAMMPHIRDHVQIVKDLHETWYGAREIYFKDVNGYIICLNQAVEQPAT